MVNVSVPFAVLLRTKSTCASGQHWRNFRRILSVMTTVRIEICGSRSGQRRHALEAGSHLLAVLLLMASGRTSKAAIVDFNRDIRPLMADTCFHCHGFDEKARKAELRLDVREEALK